MEAPLLKPVSRMFRSTPPRGERQPLRWHGLDPDLVSIHAPARGATSCAGTATRLLKFRSTPPRGERRGVALARADGEVSIHAPARGATPAHGGRQPRRRVSIHAPARGATRPPPIQPGPSSCFDPRPREGSDLQVRNVQDFVLGFRSTPPRGERPSAPWTVKRPHQFRSTPPRGERPPHQAQAGGADLVSIHAPARGATLLRSIAVASRHGFDPRPREGSDFGPAARGGRAAIPVSIHAPARGATAYRVDGARNGLVSIHAPARGATRPCRHRRTSFRSFDPRPREGSDWCPVCR